jgi:hypothetical protein
MVTVTCLSASLIASVQKIRLFTTCRTKRFLAKDHLVQPMFLSQSSESPARYPNVDQLFSVPSLVTQKWPVQRRVDLEGLHLVAQRIPRATRDDSANEISNFHEVWKLQPWNLSPPLIDRSGGRGETCTEIDSVECCLSVVISIHKMKQLLCAKRFPCIST